MLGVLALGRREVEDVRGRRNFELTRTGKRKKKHRVSKSFRKGRKKKLPWQRPPDHCGTLAPTDRDGRAYPARSTSLQRPRTALQSACTRREKSHERKKKNTKTNTTKQDKKKNILAQVTGLARLSGSKHDHDRVVARCLCVQVEQLCVERDHIGRRNLCLELLHLERRAHLK